LLLGLCLLFNCSEQEVVAELHSLQGSEDAVFVCRDASGAGHPYTDCPDREDADDSNASKNLSIIALVSQTVTNEVALVDLRRGEVVDTDRSTPGFGFLRVGGRPVSMATSPGGAATFVATAELGRNGIFALPTSCLSAPRASQPARDLTTWSACRLESAPGEITVVVDSEAQASCQQPEYDREPNAQCPGAVNDSTYESGLTVSGEGGVVGRRKLIVSLPDLGQLAVLDAQNVLDARAGEFPDCQVEQYLPLAVDVPAGVAQTLPPDLETTCAEVPAPTAPPAGRLPPQPAGFAVADNRLYVADQAAPVIHVIDTTASCALKELAPLLPMSLREPERVVTTRRVAVSPLTPKGKRYLYAIDAEDQPGASVMAFDVSPDATDPTPIVRRGSPELPGEKPDRLALGSSARDVTFAYRDLPYVDATGVAEFGTLCDPNPALASDDPGALARPNGEGTAGARPGLLRGLFGFVLLTDGRIGVVDVEDFDAPCRRPAQANTSEAPDFRGCANDTLTSFALNDGKMTVTNEVSCRAVEEHRFRSARLAVNDAELGVRAPSLRSFPRLSVPASASKHAIEDRPRLLGVPFFNPAAEAASQPPVTEVFVGSTRYSTDSTGEPLPLNPNSRESELLETLHSVVLPPLEPRAYASEDTVTLTYEGAYSDRVAGFLRDGSLRDPSLSFCGAGVYDVATMADYAKTVLGLEEEPAQAFAADHADYVQITSALPDEDDSYWRDEGDLRQRCATTFGPEDVEELAPARDFRIDRAFGDQLLLSPRSSKVTMMFAAECFPTAVKYKLRTGRHWALMHASSGFNHDVVESGAERACVRSCSPLKKWAKSRAFEISSELEHCRPPQSDTSVDAELDPLDQRVGCAQPDEVACVFNQDEAAGVQRDGRGSQCIFDGLTERFALYRGREPSVRDSQFQWQTTGGFIPLVMSLSALSSAKAVSPQSIQFLRQPEVMAVVDGSSLGLSLFSLDTFEVAKPSPYY
jgi:hypothetical protein